MLVSDVFMPEGLLSQSGLHVDHLIKIKKIQKTKGSKYICRNQLNKVCFQHDMFTRIIKI